MVICGISSKWSSVISGVVSLVPNFSLYVYVNDLPDVIQSYVGIFADNIKIYCSITSLIDYDIH